MRGRLSLIALALSIACTNCTHTVVHGTPVSDNAAVGKTLPHVEFAQVRTILEKCEPCHFSGGKVYAKLPFDRPETIKSLGTKLFTRIKDDNEQRIIKEFLAQ
jgi:hypothetical protein